MKRYKIVTFVLSVAVLLSVYAGAKENVVIPDPALVKIDGQYYIQLADYGKGASCCSIVQYPHFSSMDEMYTRIKNLDFSEDDYHIMCDNFERTENGLKVMDIDDLYQPKFPENVSIDRIDWYGDDYVVFWNAPSIREGIFCWSDDEKPIWQKDTEEFFDKENVEVLDYSENETDKYTLTKRTYIEHVDRSYDKKYIREDYKSVNGDSYCEIVITYYLGAISSILEIEDISPESVRVFTGNGDKYWYITLYGDSIETGMDLDIDWLMSFDVEKYVPALQDDKVD